MEKSLQSHEDHEMPADQPGQRQKHKQQYNISMCAYYSETWITQTAGDHKKV